MLLAPDLRARATTTYLALENGAMNLLSHLFTRAAKTPFTDVTSGFKIANRRGIRFYCKFLPAEYLGDTIDVTAMAIRQVCV